MPNARPVLSVIIVNYNTREMTLDCLNTVYTQLEGIPSEIWLVDNASSDGSVEAFRAAYPQLSIIANRDNVGFGTANNQAMEQASGTYFLLLNSDAFPHSGAISALIEYIQYHPEVGVVGPRLLNKDGSLQLSCFRFPSPVRCWLENLWLSALFANNETLGDYRRWAHDRERIVDSITGACMLVRRIVFEDLGGFDETFFMYSEETDWQRRIADRGWKVAFTPSAEVTHLAGGSGANEPARISRHFFESLDYYEWKHHGLLGLALLRAAMIAGCSLRVLLWSLVWLTIPGRRAKAGSKLKLTAWLAVRQITCWRFQFLRKMDAGKRQMDTGVDI